MKKAGTLSGMNLPEHILLGALAEWRAEHPGQVYPPQVESKSVVMAAIVLTSMTMILGDEAEFDQVLDEVRELWSSFSPDSKTAFISLYQYGVSKSGTSVGPAVIQAISERRDHVIKILEPSCVSTH